MVLQRFFGVLVILINVFDISQAQTNPPTRSAAEEYQWRIQQTHLNGDYIPASIEEALKKLDQLTSPASKSKFKSIPEDTAASKLHFSLGRWINIHWGLEEGSRLGALLAAQGVSYPDDQQEFLIRLWHRKLNARALDLENLAKIFKEKRNAEFRQSQEQALKTGKVLEIKKIKRSPPRDSIPTKQH